LFEIKVLGLYKGISNSIIVKKCGKIKNKTKNYLLKKYIYM